MENKTCQVKACEWPVVLCPELCAPHWWQLDKATRDRITRAQTAGLKTDNHPSETYKVHIQAAIAHLNSLQGVRVLYEVQQGDRATRHSRVTFCDTCQQSHVHHGVVRAFTAYLVCDVCKSMTPSIPIGSQPLPGFRSTP